MQDFTVNSLGGLLSVVVANANNTEDARGSLGMLNWLGKQLLLYSHRQRANTIEGEAGAWGWMLLYWLGSWLDWMGSWLQQCGSWLLLLWVEIWLNWFGGRLLLSWVERWLICFRNLPPSRKKGVRVSEGGPKGWEWLTAAAQAEGAADGGVDKAANDAQS